MPLAALRCFRFVDELQQVFIISSGVTSWTQPLTSIIGNVSHLFFVLRCSLVDSGQFTFAPCMSWELLDSAGTNMVGGSPIQYNNSLYHLPRHWVDSSYLTESANSPNVFLYSFAEDPSYVTHNGTDLGHRRFVGTERLRIYFSSSTSSAYTCDVYAMTHALIHVAHHGVTKSYE